MVSIAVRNIVFWEETQKSRLQEVLFEARLPMDPGDFFSVIRTSVFREAFKGDGKGIICFTILF
jgi:hypothetical protein